MTDQTKRSSRVSSVVSVLGMLILLLAAPLSSQEDDSARSFGETIDIRVVNIEAVVTDRQGLRVHGLGPEDFRITVNGEQVPITYFTEVEAGRAVAGEIREPDGTTESLPVFASGDAVGNSYLVFIDNFFAIGAQRDVVLESMAKDLRATMRPEDRMAIVAFDGKRIEMLTSWTQRTSTLERVLRQATDLPAYGLHRRAENPNGFDRDLMEVSQVFGPSQRRLQLERTADAVVSTLRSFAQPPGRKVLLLLSGGWPTGPFNEPGDGNLGASATDLSVTRPISETANLLGYTVYPVDLPGFQSLAANVDESFPDSRGAFRTSSAGFRSATFGRGSGRGPEMAGETFRLSTLRLIARDTGGKPLLFGKRTDVLDTVTQDTRAYYWLGFTPERLRDDSKYKLEVEVLRPGLEVRSRRSYRDLSRASEVGMLAQSALLFGTDDKSFDVEVGTPARSGFRRMTVPVRIAIPASAITMLPYDDDTFVADLELRVAATDPTGAQSAMPMVPMRLEEEGEPDDDARFYYEADLELRRLQHDLVVAVHDTASGAVLTRVVSVTP